MFKIVCRVQIKFVISLLQFYSEVWIRNQFSAKQTSRGSNLRFRFLYKQSLLLVVITLKSVVTKSESCSLPSFDLTEIIRNHAKQRIYIFLEASAPRTKRKIPFFSVDRGRICMCLWSDNTRRPITHGRTRLNKTLFLRTFHDRYRRREVVDQCSLWKERPQNFTNENDDINFYTINQKVSTVSL